MGKNTSTGDGGGSKPDEFSLDDTGATVTDDRNGVIENIGNATVDPEIARAGKQPDNSTAADAPKRGRGRPPKSGGKSGKTGRSGAQKETLDLGFLENILFSIHTVLAASVSVEELAITQEEAHQLAVAAKGVADYYPVYVDPKKLAIMNLLIVAGTVYGSRAVAIYAKTKVGKNKDANNVTPFPMGA